MLGEQTTGESWVEIFSIPVRTGGFLSYLRIVMLMLSLAKIKKKKTGIVRF